MQKIEDVDSRSARSIAVGDNEREVWATQIRGREEVLITTVNKITLQTTSTIIPRVLWDEIVEAMR